LKHKTSDKPYMKHIDKILKNKVVEIFIRIYRIYEFEIFVNICWESSRQFRTVFNL